jgi:hypothetical protein
MIRHPSGRPIRHNPTKRLPIIREPFDGFVLPKLNSPKIDTHAVGFITLPMRDDLYLETEAREGRRDGR